MLNSQGPVEIFCSYAQRDKKWLEKLSNHLSILKNQGLITIWYDGEISAGMDWEQTIRGHLESAPLILLLISPDFLASPFCYDTQMGRAIERHQRNEACVLPIFLRSVDNWESAPFAYLRVLPTDAKPIALWEDEDLAFVNVVAGIRRAIKDLSALSVNLPQSSFPSIWNVPLARNPFFTGREGLLARLHTQLQAGQTIALSQPQAVSGLGGIGKTQLAAEYIYRHCQDYQAVLWCHAESVATLTSSYIEIAMLLNLPEKEEQEHSIIIQATKRWLQTHQRWLLVFDNADDLDILASFLPSVANGHILITTRSRAIRHLGIGRPIEITTFDPEQGALFLLHRAGLLTLDAPLDQAEISHKEQAVQLSQELGGLPLALDQAGAYLESTGAGLEIYQRLYHEHTAQMLKLRRSHPQDHPESVLVTWLLSLSRLEEKNLISAELLRFCSFLAPDAIGEEIVTLGAARWGPILAPVANDRYVFEQAVEGLRAYSLIERDPVAKTLSIHRLVQQGVLAILSEEAYQQGMQKIVLILADMFPTGVFENWSTCERLLAHALVSTTWIKLMKVIVPEAANLLHKVGYYLGERGRFSDVEDFHKQALAIREKLSSGDTLDLADSFAYLGYFYERSGRYREAEPLYQYALDISETQLGIEHPGTAKNLDNLASLYEREGRYVEAEPLYERALRISERQLGVDHPDTAKCLNNLAGLYQRLGKLGKAEPLYLRALMIRKRFLGSEHPSTAKSLNNLGYLYERQGKYVEAEKLHTRGLEISERQLGMNHPNTAKSLDNLAGLYQKQGKYAEATSLYERALKISEQQLGAEHPFTATCLNDFAYLYERMGKYTEAEPLVKRALTIRERWLGNEHPSTARSLSNLAYLYSRQEKYIEAEALYQRAHSIYERILGKEHPYLAESLNDLADLYREQERYVEAEQLYMRALSMREQVLGSEHPDLITSLHGLAELYQGQEKRVEAELLYQRALTICQQTLDAEHPTTYTIQANYAEFLKHQKQDGER